MFLQCSGSAVVHPLWVSEEVWDIVGSLEELGALSFSTFYSPFLKNHFTTDIKRDMVVMKSWSISLHPTPQTHCERHTLMLYLQN